MDLQALLIVVILASVVTMLVRAMMAAGKKSRSLDRRTAKRPMPEAFALDDALDKLNETVRIVQDMLGPRAPGRKDPAGARFYVAYLVGIAREIARMNKVAYGPALETPIRMEMIRLGLDGTDAGEQMARIMATDEGQQGLAAGEYDGMDACDPSYNGPYFERIETYFTDAEAG